MPFSYYSIAAFHIIVCVLRLFLVFPTLWPFAFFFFNDTATTEIYTLSLHDALPILLVLLIYLLQVVPLVTL